jgi:endonuclease III
VLRFGRPTLGNKKNPFNEMLYILLSSKTPPDRYQGVYRTLRRRYRKADSLAEARPEDVAATISRGGLQRRKARAIVSIAQRLRDEFGRVTLAPLAKMANEEVEDFLISLPGVSKKTARCVLMYSFNRKVFPVDAHCFRITQRLGWVSGYAHLSDRRADEIQDGIPGSLRKDLHVAMVLLGRHHCLPKDPRCNECPLLRFCATGGGKRS